MEFDSEEIDPEQFIVSNNGECVSETGHTRIKIWCEAEPALIYTNFLDAATHGIGNLETILTSKLPGARYELVFAPHLQDTHRMHKIAEQFILEANSRLRAQSNVMLKKFLYGTGDSGMAEPSQVGSYGGFDRERNP